MQSKGAIRFVAILLLLASLWQLSFTLVANRQENKAEKYAEAKAEAAMTAAAFGKVAEADKAFYLDSIRKVENRRYIDSISSEKIYLGYTYKDVQAKSINLGLDLKGVGELRSIVTACKSLYEVFKLHLKHYVHTTLEVETEVDCLCLYVLVSVSEINLLR